MKLSSRKRMRYLCTIHFLLFSCGCYCQLLLGLGAGFASNHLQTNILNRSYSALEDGTGTGADVLLNFKVNDRFELQTGIESINKNYSIKRVGLYEGVFENFQNTYLQIPILVKINILQNRKFYLTLNIGLYGGYWIKGKIKGATPNIYNSINDSLINGQSIQSVRLSNYSTTYTFSQKIDNRIELGWLPGMTLNYNLKNFFRLFISTAYYVAITDQQKNYTQQQIPKRNQTFVGSAGCFIQINKLLKKSGKKAK